MPATTPSPPPWRRLARRALPAVAVVGVGPWGALAGGFALWAAADIVGAPEGLDSWGVWAALVGMMAGFASSAHVALALVRRSPRVLGGITAVLAVLSVVAIAGNRSRWDWLALLVPGVLLTLVVMWWDERHRT